MKGLFTPSELRRKTPLHVVPMCGLCRLDKGCKSRKMPVYGKGLKKALVIGEAPGKDEDEQNRPFVGEAGKLLKGVLRRFGYELARDCWVTNAVICRPKKNVLPERSIEHCRPNVMKAVRELRPEKILLLGASAVKSLFGWLWKEGDAGGIGRWAGGMIPCQEINTWLCPTYHPSHLLRDRKGERYKNLPLETWFERHLEAFCKLEGRPWPYGPPRYERQARVEMDTDRAALAIDGVRLVGWPVAFDIETDRLKPDHDDSHILCCSVSNGKVTLGYPWHGKAVEATKALLASGVPKLGYNVKFEQRWADVHGIKINNWLWDGMLAAHALDSRKNTKSLEHQVFLHLGISSHKSLREWMQSKGSNEKNRLNEVDKYQLFKYCSLDSLLEWHLAQVHMKKFGMKTNNFSPPDR